MGAQVLAAEKGNTGIHTQIPQNSMSKFTLPLGREFQEIQRGWGGGGGGVESMLESRRPHCF